MLPSWDLLQTVIGIAREAGSQIMAVYEKGSVLGADIGILIKHDDSPLTQADLRAHNVILSALQQLTPDVPVLSEESDLPPYDIRKTWHSYWLVDPLDGTKEFISHNGEFTVNIALIHRGEPVMGVVYVPVTGVSYAGLMSKTGSGAWKLQQGSSVVELIKTASTLDLLGWSEKTIRVVASRRHGSEQFENVLAKLSERAAQIELVRVGSSLKICLIAEGKADLYPRFGPTSEWDTAAAHAVLRAAGGDIVSEAFEPLVYNGKDSMLNPSFMALAGPPMPWKKLLSGILSSE
jgi:3'(2'), 5'-bisphosphate nucleotidase